MKNQENIEYTYKHRKIVKYLAEKYIQKNKKEKIKQIEEHDIDKIYMYLIYEKKEVSRIHRKISKHHQNEKEKTEVDYGIRLGKCKIHKRRQATKCIWHAIQILSRARKTNTTNTKRMGNSQKQHAKRKRHRRIRKKSKKHNNRRNKKRNKKRLRKKAKIENRRKIKVKEKQKTKEK